MSQIFTAPDTLSSLRGPSSACQPTQNPHSTSRTKYATGLPHPIPVDWFPLPAYPSRDLFQRLPIPQFRTRSSASSSHGSQVCGCGRSAQRPPPQAGQAGMGRGAGYRGKRPFVDSSHPMQLSEYGLIWRRFAWNSLRFCDVI
jgi:hypothetical protein